MMEPQPIVDIKTVTVADRIQLIQFVEDRPIIWCLNMPSEALQINAAWEFIAQALTSRGRIFDVALVKRLWTYLRSQYVKIMKSDDPSKSNWQYLQQLAFLGTEFTLRKSKDGSEPPKKKSKKKAAADDSDQEETSSAQKPMNVQYFPHQRFGQPLMIGQFMPSQFGQYPPQGQFIPQQFDQSNGMTPEMSYYQQQQQLMNPTLFQPQMQIKNEPEQPRFNNFTPNHQQPMIPESQFKFEYGQPRVSAFGAGQHQTLQFNYGHPMQQQFNASDQQWNQSLTQSTKTEDEYSGYVTSEGANNSSLDKPSSVPSDQMHNPNLVPSLASALVGSVVHHSSVVDGGQEDPHKVFAQLRDELAGFIHRLADLESKL